MNLIMPQPNRDLSFIFFGTPEFALPSLQKLVESKFNISLVVTSPDRPKGRGLKLEPPSVKELALKLGLPVYQPSSLKDTSVVEAITSTGCDGLVVVAYGRLLPPEIFNAFPLGAVNVHPSLLPQYRGPSPIRRAILNGEVETGVTIMLIDDKMDGGPILARKKVPIGLNETYGELSEKLAYLGGELLAETLPLWAHGDIKPIEQNHEEASYAPPLDKNELLINWKDPLSLILRKCRAFDPVPGAYTFWKGKRIKCFKAKQSRLHLKESYAPGRVIGADEEGLLVYGGDGFLIALGEVQMEGRKKLRGIEFLRGLPELKMSFLGG